SSTTVERKNREVVLSLYEALSSRDVETVTKILAPNLDRWFHGPPSHQFLMRLLTQEISESFEFVPKSIAPFGSIVIAEGCDSEKGIYWVHAWTLTDGIITQVKEYFNTFLTVTRFKVNSRSKSKLSSTVWESSLSNLVGKSVPGLVLAI
ncbi:Wound-induced protein 1, partial [Linum perenne]